MSNLNKDVRFNVLRGWPEGGAIELNLPASDGVTLREGEFVVIEDDSDEPKFKHPPYQSITDAGVAEGSTNRPRLYVVLQGNDQWDAKFVGKVTALRGLLTIETEKVVAPGSLSPGDPLTVEEVADAPSDSDTPGYLKARSGDEPIVGEVIKVEDDTVVTAALFLR